MKTVMGEDKSRVKLLLVVPGEDKSHVKNSVLGEDKSHVKSTLAALINVPLKNISHRVLHQIKTRPHKTP